MRVKPKFNALPCRDKRRYKTGGAARRALRNVRNYGEKREGKPARPYPCPDCNGWHLTSEAR